MKNNFGKTLSQLMKEKRISGRSLAKGLSVPYRTIQEWAGPGSRMPRDPDTIRQMAEFFSVSTHYLLFGEEDPHSMLGEILHKTELHTGLYEITIRKVSAKKSGGKIK